MSQIFLHFDLELNAIKWVNTSASFGMPKRNNAVNVNSAIERAMLVTTNSGLAWMIPTTLSTLKKKNAIFGMV